MRVLMTGGGTGGHVNPAIAIADTIKAHIPDAEIAFVGTKRGIENKLVPAAGYELYHVDVRGFRRSLSPANIRAAFLALVSPLAAKKIVKKFRPDVVIGTGGYVSWPLIVAASRLGIPSAVHESNAVPGLAVRKLVPYVDRIFVNFEVTGKALGAPEKTMHVGSPLRSDFGMIPKSEARAKLGLPDACRRYIVSFGGSLGAAALNKAAAYMLGESAKEKKYQHIHGYGQHDEKFLDEVHAAGVKEEENPQIRMLEYIDNMPECLAAADLVIGRAGAITLTEIEATGKCSILIPSPNVAENHQFHNAMALVNRDAAVMIEEKDLTGEKLWETVNTILSEPGRAEEIGKNAKAMAVLDANDRIYNIICEKAKK